MTGPRTPAAAPHEISWIEDGRVLLLVLRGFWDDDASAAFERGVRSALASGAGEAFHAVCDATALTVQRSETQERIQRLLDEMRSAGMVAGGMVVESALLKLQVGRTVDLDRTRFFPDRSKAIAWARQQLLRRAERKATPERATPVPRLRSGWPRPLTDAERRAGSEPDRPPSGEGRGRPSTGCLGPPRACTASTMRQGRRPWRARYRARRCRGNTLPTASSPAAIGAANSGDCVRTARGGA